MSAASGRTIVECRTIGMKNGEGRMTNDELRHSVHFKLIYRDFDLRWFGLTV